MSQTLQRISPATPGAYARLAKLDVFDYYLSVPLVWTLLVPAARFGTGTLATLLLWGLGSVFLIAALVAFDDVAGYRDGSDRRNYGPDAPARRLARKPLLTGEVSEAEAVRFGWACSGIAAVIWATAVVAAPERPTWALVGAAVTLVLGVQYSWGLRLSYHGFQELFIAALGWGLMLPLYGLVAGSLDGFVVVQALIFGLGPLLFGVYSNTNDIEGDRSVNRPTVAALVSPASNVAFVAAVSLTEAALILIPAAFGVSPWWFVALMIPVLALRLTQFNVGMIRGDILKARRIGIHTSRIAAVLMLCGNLVAGGIG